MGIRSIILIFCYCLFLVACRNEVQIIGKWKREINSNFEDQRLVENTGWGDISFATDSTFNMQGDTTVRQVNDTISGWYVGGSVKGTWRLEGNHLLLFVGELPRQFPLRYEVVQLTDSHLVLLSNLDKGDSTMNLTYTRVK